RYGTIPIVRATGGLKDTVMPFDPETGEGTGFVFQDASGDALFSAVNQALAIFANPSAWRRLVRNAMAQDFSWRESATRYVDLYQRTIAGTKRT
ncbi:MAG TPA: starch synthase, partial [Methylomirabilota bacterium]|nr:starch synthase [Methylomirabilota bacterium]